MWAELVTPRWADRRLLLMVMKSVDLHAVCEPGRLAPGFFSGLRGSRNILEGVHFVVCCVWFTHTAGLQACEQFHVDSQVAFCLLGESMNPAAVTSPSLMMLLYHFSFFKKLRNMLFSFKWRHLNSTFSHRVLCNAQPEEPLGITCPHLSLYTHKPLHFKSCFLELGQITFSVQVTNQTFLLFTSLVDINFNQVVDWQKMGEL